MASSNYFMFTFFLALSFSSINVGLAARHLLQLPPLTSVPNLPMPTIPNLPQPTLPTAQPNLPKPSLPPIPSLPNMPIVPKLTLPPLPSMPSLPTIPATIPAIPFLALPPGK